MKLRIFTIISVVLFCTGTVWAQKGGSISIGGTPGLSYMLAQNAYYFDGDHKELDYKAKFSYHVFVQGGYNFKEQHGFVTYANFCQEGQRYKDEFKWSASGHPEIIGTHEKEVDFKYMGFGVLYRFSPLLAGQKQHIRTDDIRWRMKLLVGVETDFLLNAQMKYKITTKGTTTANTMPYPIPASLGGYPGYEPNNSDNYKSFFKTVQGVGVLKFGFDYTFTNNLFLGFAVETKFGFNDINADAYRKHPEYRKSKNYFLGLNVEFGYNFQKDANKTKTPKAKKTGIDLNKKVDTVDKATKKKYK